MVMTKRKKAITRFGLMTRKKEREKEIYENKNQV